MASLSSSPLQSRREQWIALLIEIAEPVIDRFLSRTILTDFPIKFSSHLSPDLYAKNRVKVHVELFARTLLGISPLFRHHDYDSLQPSAPLRGAKKVENAEICKKILEMIQVAFGTVQSPPLLAFYQMDRQLIVEMALIILAFVRVPLLWQSIPFGTQHEILKVAHFAVTQFKPHNNNWLLFQAIIDLFLTKQRYRVSGTPYNGMRRVMENLARIESYYVGDGWYKDEVFHMDYYNSFVIHPFLVDIYRELGQTALYQRAVGRMLRHADFLERLIGSDGTYPIFGRSAVYRTGVFHAFAYAPYHWTGSPQNLFKLAAAREGMTAVLERSFKTEPMKSGNFGKEWNYLTLGFTGEQPGIADGYSNSGSVYYALLIFTPVGLPESHPFWSMDDEEGGGWSQRKAWRGEEIRKDTAITF